MKRLLTYFKFSKTEQNGFFVILVIIILFIILYTIITKQRTGDPIPNQVKVFEQSFHDSTEIVDSPNKKYINENAYLEKKNNIHKKRPTIDSDDAKLFYFNPNNLPATEWRKLGLSDRQITVIKNYEKKGGTFKAKGDLKKVYSINSKLYKRLEPYINITPVVEKEVEKAPMLYDKFETNKNELIDVNRCDTVALMRLKGIGTILSKRILKYRDVLGGFYRIEQLKEVYGVSTETYEMIKNEIVVSNVDEVKKININQIDANSLAKHPYLSPKDARLIINYRDQHGNYANIEDLAKIGTLSDLAIAKIAPYLIFENDSR